MVVLQSMWIGPNHYWNFMESGSESATYILNKMREFDQKYLKCSETCFVDIC